MEHTFTPIFGFVQPANGSSSKINYCAMGKPKKTKVAGFMRSVLSDNLQKLMSADKRFKDLENETQQYKALAKESGVSYSTIQRFMKKQTGASLDNIESVAGVFDLSVYQLMIPELDVANPQIVQGASKSEEKAYRRWKQSAPVAA